ncbi:murein hydrolase activator EnvC [Clostridium sp. DJ247]|uniref:murein hydrolase activator EnvC family protein n=1 Tax=Clostridium sp. DJ247 TaxID=2726188 RepID=UPI0016287064|nr:M23 family metallopeptidase [Clostridium sp. DJ247]MBC2580128.1 peptidoglycan DD-metalloendopeptidase family protein [Clostridium sp. DJ247]
MRRSIILAITLAVNTSMFTYAYAAGIEDSQKKLNEINNSIYQKKDKLKDINNEKNNAEKELDNLDKNMSKVSSRLQELKGRIEGLNSKIGEKEKEIEIEKQEFSKANQLFMERVRVLYELGNVGYLDAILSATDLSDLISRIDMVRRIMEYDNKLIVDIRNRQQSLEKSKLELEKNKKTLTALKSEADEKYKSLQVASNEKRQLVVNLEKDKTFYENMISKEESESKDITRTIQNLKSSSSKPSVSRGNSVHASSASVSSNGKLFSVTGGAYPITSPFGMRYHPVLKYSRLHAGIDIGVPMNTPIYALKDGVVIAAQSMSGYGNVVMINHGDITSVYGHNSSVVVSVGQRVSGGQLISYSGNSGVSSGPHLHFETRNSDGQPIEPSGYYIR